MEGAVTMFVPPPLWQAALATSKLATTKIRMSALARELKTCS
jgi:hypothetical protein